MVHCVFDDLNVFLKSAPTWPNDASNDKSTEQMSPADSGISPADSFVASVASNASSFSHGSPYSSMASPCPSQQGFFDSR